MARIPFVLVALLLTAAHATGQTALPTITAAGYDAHGRFTVNGQPFFPIVLYDAPSDPETLAKLRDSGFNVVTTTKPEDAAALPAQGFYAAVHAHGKIEDRGGIFLGIGTDSPALNFKDKLLETVQADLKKVRESLPDRPIMHAIGYWEDEPAGVKAGKLPAPEKYEHLAAAIDVAAPYLYPVPYQPIASVGDAVARAREASQGKKPVLPILQLFIWEPTDRYPTPAELRCMVMLSLIEGGSGVGYYSYGYVSGKKGTNIAAEQPGLWGALKAINAEARAAGTFMHGAERDAGLKVQGGDGAVRAAALRKDGREMVLVVNTADAAKTASITFTAPPKGDVKSGGKRVAVEGSTLKVELGAFDAATIEFGG